MITYLIIYLVACTVLYISTMFSGWYQGQDITIKDSIVVFVWSYIPFLNIAVVWYLVDAHVNINAVIIKGKK